jgi:hypothetical protein
VIGFPPKSGMVVARREAEAVGPCLAHQNRS